MFYEEHMYGRAEDNIEAISQLNRIIGPVQLGNSCVVAISDTYWDGISEGYSILG